MTPFDISFFTIFGVILYARGFFAVLHEETMCFVAIQGTGGKFGNPTVTHLHKPVTLEHWLMAALWPLIIPLS